MRTRTKYRTFVFLTLVFIMILLLGCDEKEKAVLVGPEEYIIFDNDFGFSDPDNDGALAFALALQKQKRVKILALGRIGYDIANNGTLIAAAQLAYWGYPNTPIGINPNRERMRDAYTIAATSFPPQADIYQGDFQDIRQFVSDGCINNNLGCGGRVDSIEMYRKALEDSPKKVVIVAGGQLINIAESLRAHPDLFKEKVKKITFLGRTGDGELTGQNFGGNEYAIWALKYLIDNLPDTIDLIECSTDTSYIRNYQKIPQSRIGPIYNEYHINSPIAFVYSAKHPYGIGLIDGFSIIDGLALLQGIYGSTLPDGTSISTLERVTFETYSDGAHIKKKSSRNHYIMQSTQNQWKKQKEYLEEVLIEEDK